MLVYQSCIKLSIFLARRCNKKVVIISQKKNHDIFLTYFLLKFTNFTRKAFLHEQYKFGLQQIFYSAISTSVLFTKKKVKNVSFILRQNRINGNLNPRGIQ